MINNNMSENKKNPWSYEDERGHDLSAMEWWCIEGFFKSKKESREWHIKGSFVEWLEKSKITGSYHSVSLFDMKNNVYKEYYSRNDNSKLKKSKDIFTIHHLDSFLKGVYPNYHFYHKDSENDIEIDLKYNSKSLPRWIAQDITNGWLPMGFGTYRYGFIPNNDIHGKIKIGKETYELKGKGYYEHVWGDFLYNNPLLNFVDFKKTIRTYTRLIDDWLHKHRVHIPKSIKLSSENNPFGYDWIWAIFDNDWSIFYGNILFWFTEGPVMGNLTLTKDGVNFIEFSNISFKYNKMCYSKKYDIYFPTDIEIIGLKGNEKIHLFLKSNVDFKEYFSRFDSNKHWLGLVIYEIPGTIEGYYIKDNQKINLNGVGKFEPQRQISRIGHHSLKIDFLMPPEGFGFNSTFKSHLLKKKVNTKIILAPRTSFNFNIKSIDKNKINSNNNKK